MSDRFIEVEASQVFRRNLQTLAKKNPLIQKDVQPVVEQLERGELLGDRFTGIGYEVLVMLQSC